METFFYYKFLVFTFLVWLRNVKVSIIAEKVPFHNGALSVQ
jgi:hypothetical protein